MSRFGTPIYAPAQECVMLVTIERNGEFVGIRTWRSRNGARAIRRAVKLAYSDCDLQFGNSFWRTR